MANNYVQSGDRLTLTAPYQRNSGQAAKIGASIIAIALQTVANGIAGEWATRGVWLVEKATGAAWVVGDKLYWDDTAKKFTTTSAGNTLAGVATVAAASGDATGYIRLNGSF